MTTGMLTEHALSEMLASWLPRQRWFPGRGSFVGELAIVSDEILLDGDPQLRHLIVETGQVGLQARFQVLAGCRGELPRAIAASAVIGQLPGMTCYDALHDPELAAVLLDGIAQERTAGPLRFVREPGAPLRRQLTTSRVLTAEQSNTSLVFGEAAILKVLRRLFPGPNPDLEVADALARLGSDRVAAPYGWVETRLDGEPVLLAVLSEFLAGASDGWSLATGTLARLYAQHGGYGQEYLTAPVAADVAAEAGVLPFAAEARQLGMATAQMHVDMATAFGSRPMTPDELATLVATLHAKLDQAAGIVPELAAQADRIGAAYDDLSRISDPIMVQRIHGDYHLGQVLYSQHGWVALDFEGEPAAPLAERRALAPAMRDVAGMLRSFDYAARHQLVGQPEHGGQAAMASAWVMQCEREFCAGYSAGGGANPTDQAALLRALTLEKAVYEVIYEYRHRPDWLSIPLDYVAAA